MKNGNTCRPETVLQDAQIINQGYEPSGRQILCPEDCTVVRILGIKVAGDCIRQVEAQNSAPVIR